MLAATQFATKRRHLGGPGPAPFVGTLAPVAVRQIRRRRPLSYLGAAVAATSSLPASVQACFPLSSVKSTAGFTQQDQANFQAAVQARYLPAYTGAACQGKSTASTATTATTAATSAVGAVLLKVGGATGPAAPFVLAAGAALEVLGDVFGIFGSHHAAAVKKEQLTLCDYMPAANSALQAVDAGLAGGQLTSSAASAALDQILSAFRSGVSGIIKMDSGDCNAACVYYRMLCGIVAQRKLDMAANPPPADQGGTAVISAETGLSPLELAVGAFALLYMIL